MHNHAITNCISKMGMNIFIRINSILIMKTLNVINQPINYHNKLTTSVYRLSRMYNLHYLTAGNDGLIIKLFKLTIDLSHTHTQSSTNTTF